MKKNEESTQKKQLHNAEVLAISRLDLRRKALLAGVTAFLVLLLVVGMMLAWYTRLTNVTGLTFEVASFDVNASYVLDSYIINPFSYDEVEGDTLVAPGTTGYIPVKIYADSTNEVDITYRLNIDTRAMASEFYDKIRFFYYTLEEGTYVEHDLGSEYEDVVGYLPLETEHVMEYIYWEWEYEADISPILIAPTEKLSSDEEEVTYTSFSSLHEMTNTDIYNAVLYWRTSNFSDIVSAYYTELCADALVDPDGDTSISILINLYNGNEVTASGSGTYGNEESTTYPAVEETESDYISKRGANIRDYLENYVMYEWDYIDTQIAIGAWDETFTSENGSTYTEETVERTADDGTTTTTETFAAYQMAMQITLEMTALQAEPLEPGDETDQSTGAGTVKLESSETTE